MSRSSTRRALRAPAAVLALTLAAAPALAAQRAALTTVAPSVPPAGASISWAEAAALPVARDHHVTFVTSGGGRDVLHVLGGHAGGQILGDAWRARINKDGSLGGWEKEAALPVAHAGMAVAGDGRFVVVAGGKAEGNRTTADVYVANVWNDGRLGAWAAAPWQLPAPRFHTSALMNDGWVYVIGGLDAQQQATSTVWRAKLGRDGVLGTWSALDSLPGARSHHAAFVKDGAIYLVAGLAGNPAGENTPLRDVLRATIRPDGTLGAWTTISQLDSAYATHSAVVEGGYLWVIGGVENNARFTDHVQRAPFLPDGGLGAWETIATPLPAARSHVHQTPVVRDHIYSVGGAAGNKTLDAVTIGTFSDAKR